MLIANANSKLTRSFFLSFLSVVCAFLYFGGDVIGVDAEGNFERLGTL